jgi:hypothetical protein
VAAQILLQNFLDSLHLSSEFGVPGSGLDRTRDPGDG